MGQTQRVSMTVEVFGMIEDLYSTNGHVSKALAKHLGLDPEAGWRMSDVATISGPLGPGRVTVKAYRDIPFDIAKDQES